MAYRNVKQGWHRIENMEKFLLPLDEHMGSYRRGEVLYKSGLELTAIAWADYSHSLVRWSLEPYAVPYMKPTDRKVHRYFPDLYVEFDTGFRYLIEVKSSGETKPPKKPRVVTHASAKNYNRAVMNWHVNNAKWDAAQEFTRQNGMRFTLLTEKQLKKA